MPASMRSTRKPNSGDPCAVVERIEYSTPNMYVPVNVPGAAHGGPSYVGDGWYTWYAKCVADQMDRVGAPIAVLIRERNCPFPFNTGGNPTSPGEVPALLDALPKLDYLFMDLEPFGEAGSEDVIRNVEEIVRLVRGHPNPRVSGAFIGNYDDWPGKTDGWMIWPERRDRTSFRRDADWDRDRFYRDHLNIAMPPVYPHQVHSRHTHRGIQRDGPVAPNERAAIFWAPLERLSEAARHLPEGHLLIPWVTNYGAHNEESDVYTAPPPSREDLEALIRHVRLRGAYSYMVWTANRNLTAHPTIDHTAFTRLALDAWSTLDPLFESGETPRILNLETDKASGVQWSGVVAGDRVWVLVSNLGPEDAVTVSLPSLRGVPTETPPVPRGAHRLFRWRLAG